LDGFQDFVDGLAAEGGFTAEEDIQKDAGTPHVALLVVGVLQDFWRYVVWRAGHFAHQRLGSGREPAGGAEVDHFDVKLRVVARSQEQVLWLDISMHDSLFVTISQSREQLSHYIRCHLQTHHSLLLQIPEQLASFHKPTHSIRSVLCHQVKTFRIYVGFVELEDVRMVLLR
jgi:hypothetical protein